MLMVETVLERTEKLKKDILDHLTKSKETSHINIHDFTLSGISCTVPNYTIEEVKAVLDDLCDKEKDNQLIRKTFETEVYISKTDENFTLKFREYFKPKNIWFVGTLLITAIIYVTPFSIFNYPENFKGGVLLGLWLMSLFGRFLGEWAIKIYNLMIEKLSEVSSLKKRSISVVLITTITLLIILFIYSKEINGIAYSEVPAWEIIATLAAGLAVGTVLSKWLFNK